MRFRSSSTASLALAFVSLGSVGSASADVIAGQGTWEQTLSARDLDGNWANGPEAWYDRTLGITWLADPQAIAGTRWDTYFRGSGGDDAPYNESDEFDGRSLLSDGFFWVNQLSPGGITGWRLPTTDPINGQTYRYSGGDGQTVHSGQIDVGWNIASTHSELAHMFTVTLGNRGAFDTDGRPRDVWERVFNTGVFDHLKPRTYWSGSRYSSQVNDIAWVFDFSDGKQHGGFSPIPAFPDAYHVWAVHDGDVGAAMSPVPTPPSAVLLAAGLVALAGLARRKLSSAA